MKEIRKLLHFVKPYWQLSVASLVLLTAVLFIDLSIPRLIQQTIDKGVTPKNMTVILQTSAWMLGLSALQFLIAIGNNIFSIRVGEGVARDLREALFVKIQSFSYGNIDHFTTGRLMVRLSSDSGAVQRIFQVSLRIGTRAPLLMIGSLILMFNTNPNLALTILPLLIVTSVVIVFFSIKMEPLFMSVQQKLDRLNTVLQENIAGARLVKAFVRADHENDRFESANLDLTERNIRVMTFMSTMSPLLTFFVNIGLVVVVYAGGLRVIQGSMTNGQIIAFANYLSTTMGPLIMMTHLANTWANGIASARRINEVLETVPEVQDEPHAEPMPEHSLAKVEFQNVCFHYNGSVDTTVLEGINLTAEPGEMVAILGATGAGKSSLVNLIPRFYDPSDGRVLINGVDIRTVQQDSLVQMVGIVPQETILFSGSVRDNIRYGRPSASDDEVIAAAKAAQAHDFILKLPEGYDTHVEERGVNLSGGQKQRIAIARALVTQPKILILDDSTSSVDVETETKIQDALQQQLRNSTSFVVAQRISTVLKADKIVVIDQGKIVAQGTHAELMQTSPIYQEIYDSQLGSGPREFFQAVPVMQEVSA
ncbi:MAG TPA: ABC transporter ATP-binding protein [Anaerolineaceae bacterium]